MKTIHHRKISVALVATMVLLWAVSAAMADDRMPESASNTRSRLDIDRLATEKISLTIETKEHDRIRTQFWDFKVTDRTEFVTKKGDLVSFKDFKVPCQAVIHYEPSNTVQNSRTAWRVNIQKVGNSATDEFSDPDGY